MFVVVLGSQETGWMATSCGGWLGTSWSVVHATKWLFFQQDIQKRLSLPADLRLPLSVVEKLNRTPTLDQPLTRKNRRASLVWLYFVAAVERGFAWAWIERGGGVDSMLRNNRLTRGMCLAAVHLRKHCQVIDYKLECSRSSFSLQAGDRASTCELEDTVRSSVWRSLNIIVKVFVGMLDGKPG